MISLPTELVQLLRIDEVHTKQVKTGEFHGPCPRCGGTDRFIIHAIRDYPHWLVMCRQCNPEWRWLDELDNRFKTPMSDAERKAYAEEKHRMEEQRQAVLARRIQEFTNQEVWEALNRRMTAENRHWWELRGIPQDWQDYLQLGFMPSKNISFEGFLYTTPAYTIPYLRGDKAITMQYRLLNPPKPNDKYRFENGLPAAWYSTEPTLGLKDAVVITEGAIKAIVTKILGNPPNATVLGVPSKNAWGNVTDAVKDCGRVWIVLDPDGTKDAIKLAQKIGKNARVVELPAKIDDMLNENELTDSLLAQLLKTGRKVTT